MQSEVKNISIISACRLSFLGTVANSDNVLLRISRFVLVFSLAISFSKATNGQFSNVSNQIAALNVQSSVTSNTLGSGISFYDFDNDGWDDLTLPGMEGAKHFLRNNNGVLETASFSIPAANVGTAMSVIWIDFDNDGDPDFFSCHYEGPVQLWENDGDFNFTNITAQAGFPTGNYRFSNSVWGDYNHDGLPDLYLTLYYTTFYTPFEEFSNQLYRNNGDGTFTNVTEEAGVFIPPSTTLQAIWVDLNNDGWEDLFVAEDKINYPNEIFINNHDGTFTRTTEGSGVDEGFDSMSAAVSDFNQDGFLDIYVTNNPYATGNRLYENNGDGTFTNIAIELGMNVMMSCWGAVWFDYNNNSRDDLFVGTVGFNPVESLFFVNHGDYEFENHANQFGLNSPVTSSYNCARGDLNNDGYFDLATNNYNPIPHQLYRNQGGSNNWLSVTLEGTIANRDGLGTWIRCYVEGECFVKYTLNSENLGGQNSRKNIFGLGSATQVDSLVLEWNSGTREVYLSPEINTHQFYKEGASFIEPFAIETSGSTFLCPGDSVILTAGEFESYLWNTGDTTQSIVVTEPGEYTVEVINEFSFAVSSLTEVVDMPPAAQVDFNVQDVSCSGAEDGMIELNLSTGAPDSITWNNGATHTIIQNLSGGIYSFSGTDQFGCAVFGEVFVNEPSPLTGLISAEDALCFGDSSGTASANALGGTPPYNTIWGQENPESLFAGDYSAHIVDDNGCELGLNYTVGQPDSLWAVLETSPAAGGNNGEVNVEVFGGTPPFQIAWSTGDTSSFGLTGLAPGAYVFSATDNNSCVFESSFSIDNTTGIGQNPEARFNVFPNPSRGDFDLSGCGAGTQLTLYNVYGQPVLRQLTDSYLTRISASHLPAGSYLLGIQKDNLSHIIRVALIK